MAEQPQSCNSSALLMTFLRAKALRMSVCLNWEVLTGILDNDIMITHGTTYVIIISFGPSLKQYSSSANVRNSSKTVYFAIVSKVIDSKRMHISGRV
jgi:hypothetical protein